MQMKYDQMTVDVSSILQPGRPRVAYGHLVLTFCALIHITNEIDVILYIPFLPAFYLPRS